MKEIKNFKLKTRNSREAGVTLLLSVMIISGLTLIVVSVAAFAVQELRASRAQLLSEPTIAAAESGGERGLWSIKRETGLETCPLASVQTFGANNLATYCKSYGAATIAITGGSPYTFFLYDPDNINGDADLIGYPYSSISIQHSSGTYQVNVSVSRLDGSTTGISPSSVAVSPGATQSITISPVLAGSEGRMKVVLSSTGNATVIVNTNRGMPTFPTIDSTACGSRGAVSSCTGAGQELFTRRIQVTVPQ
jgi:hypothetical protein